MGVDVDSSLCGGGLNTAGTDETAFGGGGVRKAFGWKTGLGR